MTNTTQSPPNDRPSLEAEVRELAARARVASQRMGELSTERKNAWLARTAERLEAARDHVLEANARDIEAAAEKGVPEPMRNRLGISDGKWADMIQGLRDVIALPDPVGRITNHSVRPNGLRVGQMAIPLGVIAMIYEARPNVTVDAAALCLKAGNAVILRGGSEAFHSNRALGEELRAAARDEGVPEDAITILPTTDRAAIDVMLKLNESIDLVIPRGGSALIRKVMAESTIPVIAHDAGVCHVFLDESADPEMAVAIVHESKLRQMPVCNGLETLLCHRGASQTVLPRVLKDLHEAGVEIRGCARTRELFGDAVAASEADWSEEFPRPDPGRARGRLDGRRDRSHPPLRLRPHGDHRDRELCEQPGVAAPRELVDRRRELLDGLLRRLPARARRRDRYLDLEAPRLRTDGPRRAHDAEVRADGRRTAARMTGRVGLFGGTFNPIHLGHLRAAEEVREALALERVLFIPSRIPPHKQADAQDPIAPTDERLAWVERAIADHDHFAVDRIEIDREGPSYLVDTLRQIQAREAGRRRTVFIVGADAFAEMGEWRDPESIFALTDLAVMTRPPGQLAHLGEALPEIVRDRFELTRDGGEAVHREAGTRIELIPISALDISSSRIRAACRSGHSIRFLVPETIRERIEASGRYGPPPLARAAG